MIIIAVDFDGTLVENAYPEIGELLPGAKEYVNKLYDEGFGIVINTCRSGKYESEVYKFLEREGIKFHHLNENFPHLIELYNADCRKISCNVNIDDKNIFGLASWEVMYKVIKQKYG
jgi:hydroxymethylpyrimidine pyrophosphatase-like HAD family hydrolase